MSARILYIDDSGKPEQQHASRAVVLAGFAINAEDYGTLSRRLLGAKQAFFPGRGLPQTWEIKSPEIIKPNPWKRSKNRRFSDEIVRLLSTMGATTYAATIDKSRMKHAMSLATSMQVTASRALWPQAIFHYIQVSTTVARTRSRAFRLRI